jgi:TPR repeat protein
MPFFRTLLLAGCAIGGGPEAGPPLSCKTHDDGLAFWQKGDIVSAATCWRPLAEAGNARARMALGLALDRQPPGRWNFFDDPKRREAEHWLTLAAEQQLPNAEYELGQFLLRHWCLPKRERCELARDWLERAGWHEQRKAQEALSELYANPDLPVTADIKAYYWNERVLDRSSDSPPRFLARKQRLGEKLSAEQKEHEHGEALHTTWFRYFRVYNEPIGGTGAYWVIDSVWDRNSRQNSYSSCAPFLEKARGGNVMAAYGLGYLLSQYIRPEEKEKFPCL